MTLTSFPGGFNARVGFNSNVDTTSPSSLTTTAVDAANEAVIWIGYIATSDGGSHTIDTSGSSSLNWRSATVTFSNGGTTLKVGLAAVDTATGPPGRAVNASDVITFDVHRSMTGGGGSPVTNTWNTHVPTAGTKTIANGALVAFAIQMTARGGADSVQITGETPSDAMHFPSQTNFLGGSYALSGALPNCMIVFSDGARGWFYGSEVFSVQTFTTFNSGSGQVEHGQLYQVPFPMNIYGIYGPVDVDANFDFVLYSDPLGTPVAERTISIDANTVASATARRFEAAFSSPYTTTANQVIAAVFKPGASNVSVYRKTLGNAADRVADSWGTNGYGISRASGGGAFSDFNSSLDHFYIGLLVGGFDNGVGGGGGVATPLFGGGVI